MYQVLKESFQEHVSLTDEQWEMCKKKFRPKRMLKRQFLLQEGDVCRELAFVEKGSLYSYSVDSKGNQHVIRFAFEGWWMANLQSFFTRKPTNLNIEVLEDSELLVLDSKNHEKLLEEIPAYERYHRIILQNAYVALQQRVENALGLTAEEKYNRLIEQNPEFMNRVPLNLVASYLGISPETLSRVRGQFSS
ncbi:cAMP-binding domain of CRP or a regulatory subunit of cAMP-dependent protein kinases [Fodinibius roseus]|uniref:cAMP-binding domain of CRP or a regulatory subunit of cAMP-dependent protein kinases n=1 Tax=Fodinibius roseus TaxID=1194090 RepID=A0A1M5G4A5_9BACT|nr:Crp/Fnr family transcriptional regulator [Fodinibius roseus]SHF98272.1 cAMP-binding domain of CRP or a regulatory subunit of cAMP-dependent protein kinases [Fodinibius roseus]